MGAYRPAGRDKPTGFTLIFSCAAFGLRGGMLGFRVPKSGRRTAAVQKLAQVRERGNSRQRLGVRQSPLPLSIDVPVHDNLGEIYRDNSREVAREYRDNQGVG